jgi:hypothetical protein
MPDSRSESVARARSLGTELVAVHQWLRAELASIRDDLDAGETSLRGSLQVHCIAFCQALTNHHTSEDNTAFSLLAEAFPELADVLEQRPDGDSRIPFSMGGKKARCGLGRASFDSSGY